MSCEVCFNLGVEETKGRTFGPNQKIAKFILTPDLRASASAGKCEDCSLLWDTLRAGKGAELPEGLDALLELKAAPGKPLQLTMRSESLHLDVFIRDSECAIYNGECRES